MFKKAGLIGLAFFTAIILTGGGCNNNQPAPQVGNIKKNMKVSSAAFSDMEKIPVKYTCDGENINPPLNIFNVPSGAKSMALIVEDPDAPGKIWSHWVAWNIPVDTATLAENSFPPGAMQGVNDAGHNRYDGPCPPGTAPHRYEFKVYALDVVLDLPLTAKKADLEKAMNEHVIDFAQVTGIYGRGN